jgi:hypothetical protein
MVLLKRRPAPQIRRPHDSPYLAPAEQHFPVFKLSGQARRPRESGEHTWGEARLERALRIGIRNADARACVRVVTSPQCRETKAHRRVRVVDGVL